MSTFLAVIIGLTIGFLILKVTGLFEGFEWYDNMRPGNAAYASDHVNIWVGSTYGLGLEYNVDVNSISIILGFLDIEIYLK